MVGILVSFWEGLFSGAMLVSGRIVLLFLLFVIWSFKSIFCSFGEDYVQLATMFLSIVAFACFTQIQELHIPVRREALIFASDGWAMNHQLNR